MCQGGQEFHIADFDVKSMNTTKKKKKPAEIQNHLMN